MRQEFDGSENQTQVFGDALDNPLAAQLKALAQDNPDDELLSGVNELHTQQQLGIVVSQRSLLRASTQKLEGYGLRLRKVQSVRERAAQAEKLTPQFEMLGRAWENLTFNRPVKKEAAMVGLQATWGTLYPMMVATFPEGREKMLRAFARGLKTSEDRPNRTYIKYSESQLGNFSFHPAKLFWDHVHPAIPLSGSTMIFTIAFLELNGYPTDHTSQIETYFGQVDVMKEMMTPVEVIDKRRGKLYGAEVTLETLIDKLNAWYTENYQINNLVDLRAK